MAVRVDLYKIDPVTGVTLTKAEQVFESNNDFLTSWSEMKTQDWSHIFITRDSGKYSEDKRTSMQKLLLAFRGGEA